MTETSPKKHDWMFYTQVAAISMVVTSIFGLLTTQSPVVLEQKQSEEIALMELQAHLEQAKHLDGLTPITTTNRHLRFENPQLREEVINLSKLCPITQKYLFFSGFSKDKAQKVDIENKAALDEHLKCALGKFDQVSLEDESLNKLLHSSTFKEFQQTPEVRHVLDQAKLDGKITLDEYFKLRKRIYKLSSNEHGNLTEKLINRL